MFCIEPRRYYYNVFLAISTQLKENGQKSIAKEKGAENMIDDNNDNEDYAECGDCGQRFSDKESKCPNCGSTKKVLYASIDEKFTVSTSIDALVTVTSASISLPSGVSTSHVTLLSSELMSEPSQQRDINISHLLIEKDASLEEIASELPSTLHDILEGGQESVSFKRGDIFYYFNCNIYGSAMGGDINATQMIFVNTWNQLKDSIDIDKLKYELQELTKELINQAKTDQELETASQVSIALTELNKANGSGMLQYLKKAGKWAADVAQKVGTDIAAKVIAEALMH